MKIFQETVRKDEGEDFWRNRIESRSSVCSVVMRWGTNRFFRMCGELRRTKTGDDGRAAKENHKKSHIQAQVARAKTRNPSAIIGVHSKTEHTFVLLLLDSPRFCFRWESHRNLFFYLTERRARDSRDSSVHFSRPRMECIYFFSVRCYYVHLQRMRLSWVKVNLPIQAS